jgi:hypothetical protein
LAALVGVLGAATFAPSLGGEFIYDDHPILEGNVYIHTFSWWQRWFTHDFWDITEEVRRLGRRMTYWRPAINASYALDWQIGHGSPMIFHVTNLLWQAVASVLAFLVLRRWIGAAVPAALAALIFALHPSKAESVAWIAGRTDLLCAVAMMVVAQGCARRLRGQKGGLALEILGTIVAYMTKEQAVTLAAFVAVETWVALGRPALDWAMLKKLGRSSAAQLAVGAAYLAIRAAVMPVKPRSEPGLPLGPHVREVLETMGRFAAITFFPHDLSLQQGMIEWTNGEIAFSAAYIAAGAAFVAALIALIWAMRARMPGVSVGLAFYLFMLLPTSNLMTVGLVAMLAERFLFIPMLGVSLAVGTLLVWVSESRPRYFNWAGSACALVAAIFGFVAGRHAADFVDERAFWERELALHPHSLEALRFKISDEREAKNFDKALELTARAQQTSVKYFSGQGFEIDFIVQGVQLMLAKIPDHDAASLRAVDRFLATMLDPRSKDAELALGSVHISVPLEKTPALRARLDVQRPHINGLRASAHSRLVDDPGALALSEEAYRECRGCIQIARNAALLWARSGRYDKGYGFLDDAATWTSPDRVLDARKILSTAEASGKAAAAVQDQAQRLQLRATELSTLEAWGRAYDVLAPAIDAIRTAPDFAMGFAELAWRAGEFRTARDVLSGLMPPPAVTATTEQWSGKMGWIDGSIALGLTQDAGHSKEGR